MKIDFNEKGMMIQFDKVPKLLYFNDERTGSGRLFLNGVQRKGLVDVKIHAHTSSESRRPITELDIKYIDKGTEISISNNPEVSHE